MNAAIDYVSGRIRKVCEEQGLDPEPLVRYVVFGIQPGDFLLAVLRDQFVETAVRADDRNIHLLYEWAQVMYSAMPAESRGSVEKVEKWMRDGGLQGKSQAPVMVSA